MTLYASVLSTPAVPWRVRHALEQWVERSCHDRHPGLYRWLHFGRAAADLRPVTSGPAHHFFGYYDKSPWNASGRLLLTHQAGFNDRAPVAGDGVGIGIVAGAAGRRRFERVATSSAWNWQQGAMSMWQAADLENRFSYNDLRDGHFVGVLHDIDRGELGTLDRPIYASLPDGQTAFSANFARLAVHRPGYGYAGADDPHAGDPHPAGDGIWRIDLASGRSDLIVSLDQLAGRDPKPSMQGAWHYVNHIQPSRGGQRIAFFHIWHRNAESWEVRLYACRPDGSELTCLLDTGFISHYDWRDDETLLIWANRPGAPARFLLLTHQAIATSAARGEPPPFAVFGNEDLREDGHCSFSPDGLWVLNDTYPDDHQRRTLMLVRADSAQRIDIARLHSPKSRWWGEIRCDLHPRWSPDGRHVCVDSVHDGSRQMYIMDVSRLVT
jgi:hypothetical protein